MRDGAMLGRELKKVADGRIPLGEALTAYERDMTAYGLRLGGIHLLRMDSTDRNTTVTTRAGYARED
jgi:hypothetical protein